MISLSNIPWQVSYFAEYSQNAKKKKIQNTYRVLALGEI